MERQREFQRPLHVCFVDLTKAFDSVNRDAMCYVLLKRGVPKHLVRLVQCIHQNTNCTVKAFGDVSESFQVRTGVRQGCTLAPLLFVIFIDHVMREAMGSMPQGLQYNYKYGTALTNWRGAPTGTVEVKSLLYADDLALTNEDSKKLQGMLSAFDKATRKWGLAISSEKTVTLSAVESASRDQAKALRRANCKGAHVCDQCGNRYDRACGLATHKRFCSGTPAAKIAKAAKTAAKSVAKEKAASLKLAGKALKSVDSFPYLGSTVSADGSTSADVGVRIEKASKAFFSLKNILWRQKQVSLKTKLRVFRAVVLSSLLYGSETWAIASEDLRRLESFLMRCQRSLLGVSTWHRIPNEEIRRRCDGMQTAEEMLRMKRLQWLGHIRRRDDDRRSKQLAWSKVQDCTRPLHGTCKRWADLVAEDVTKRHVADWYSTSCDRSGWRAIASGRTRYSKRKSAF